MRSHPGVATLLLLLASIVGAHRDEKIRRSDMADNGTTTFAPSNTTEHNLYSMPSYASFSEHSGIMAGHIIFMVLAWFFILPIGMAFH
jgi:hypothetical protein